MRGPMGYLYYKCDKRDLREVVEGNESVHELKGIRAVTRLVGGGMFAVCALAVWSGTRLDVNVTHDSDNLAYDVAETALEWSTSMPELAIAGLSGVMAGEMVLTHHRAGSRLRKLESDNTETA